MEYFESTPEGIFGVRVSLERTGTPEAAYLTWEAMVRSGFATGNAAEALHRRSINDAYIERLMLSPSLGSPDWSQVELLDNLREVCRLVDSHPALEQFAPGNALLIAGVWLRSHLLTVTLEGVFHECAEDAYRAPVSNEVINMIVWWLDVDGTPGVPALNQNSLEESLTVRFGLPPKPSVVFAARVLDSVSGLLRPA